MGFGGLLHWPIRRGDLWLDEVHADKIVKRIGFHIYYKKYLPQPFFRPRSTQAIQLNSYPSRDPVPLGENKYQLLFGCPIISKKILRYFVVYSVPVQVGKTTYSQVQNRIKNVQCSPTKKLQTWNEPKVYERVQRSSIGCSIAQWGCSVAQLVVR
jgi:hypothetical protein